MKCRESDFTSQFGDFVFEEKLFSFEFQQFKFIRGGVEQFLGNFAIQRVVTPLKLGKMVLESHAILLQKPLRN
jgi:hypothetical protein